MEEDSSDVEVQMTIPEVVVSTLKVVGSSIAGFVIGKYLASEVTAPVFYNYILLSVPFCCGMLAMKTYQDFQHDIAQAHLLENRMRYSIEERKRDFIRMQALSVSFFYLTEAIIVGGVAASSMPW